MPKNNFGPPCKSYIDGQKDFWFPVRAASVVKTGLAAVVKVAAKTKNV